MTKKKSHIILASQSKQRRVLFNSLGLEFEIIPAEIDEQQVEYLTVSTKAENIARAKAEWVQKKYPQAIVIAADTFVVHAKKALEKPNDLEEASVMLRQQSGQWIDILTGFCYLDKPNQINFSMTAITRAKFRRLTEQEIDWYVRHNPVTTWSAAFSPAYPAGAALIVEISGSFTGFSHGLPIEELIPLLIKSAVI